MPCVHMCCWWLLLLLWSGVAYSQPLEANLMVFFLLPLFLFQIVSALSLTSPPRRAPGLLWPQQFWVPGGPGSLFSPFPLAGLDAMSSFLGRSSLTGPMGGGRQGQLPCGHSCHGIPFSRHCSPALASLSFSSALVEVSRHDDLVLFSPSGGQGGGRAVCR